MGILRLKDFIRAVRACKTASDERQVVAKESASIRTSLKEDASIETRHINIAKLLYIHMLGYPAHFGQIECLKLVAGGKYVDKRLGYLGIMMLLDEQQEVLTLVTNSLKNDMNSSNIYTVGLALCTMGDIASPEMSRDLAPEIDKLLGSSNSYIKKKAALCAIKSVRKVPDLIEQFLPRAKAMLSEKNHAVLLTGVSLINEMIIINPAVTDEFRPLTSQLVRHLKTLTTAGSSPEHDVSAVNDPFLQVRILRLLRYLGKGSRQVSDSINDILTQIGTNTDSSKNVGTAILYETCLTIMEIEADNGLRVLAINILGRFLANSDNNIRYVALSTLSKTIAIDINAIQRHRNTVVDCLRDPDVSIKRRALDLSFFLINESNVRVMIRELLLFLETADDEFKASMPHRICLAADQFAPNKRWHIDTIIRVLKLAGNYVKEDVLSNFIKIVAAVPELHAYAVYKLFYSLKQDLSQESLVLAGVWIVGEYGEVLRSGGSSQTPFTADEDQVAGEDQMKDVADHEIVDLMESILESPYNSTVVTEYVLAALVKLSVKLRGPDASERARAIIRRFVSNIDLEIQQRSIEFTTLLTDPSLAGIRSAVLERMPVPPPVAAAKAHTAISTSPSPVQNATGGAPTASGKATSGAGGLLDDLLGLDAGLKQPAAAASANALTGQLGGMSISSPAAGGGMNLLADVFGTGVPSATGPKTKNDILNLFNSTGTAAVAPQSARPTPSSGLDLLGGLAAGLGGPAQQGAVSPLGMAASPQSSMETSVYEKNGLVISFRQVGSEPGPDIQSRVCAITISFRNTGPVPISELNFQVAVPKNLKLQLLPPSSTIVQPAGSTTQNMKILNPIGQTVEGQTVPLRLRLKIAFAAGTTKIDEISEFNGFGPAWKW